MIFDPIIYEEEINMYESEIALEKALNESEYLTSLIYFEKTESDKTDENNKNIIDKVIKLFKAFINKCLEYIKNAITKIHDRIVSIYTEHKLKKLLENFNNKVDEAERKGLKSFIFVDLYALAKNLNDESNAYEKEIKSFAKSYIKNASPKDAEKLLKKFNSISEQYTARISDILKSPKEFHIKEAKKVVNILEKSKDGKNNAYSIILDNHYKMCEEVEKLTENTISSLDKYSEDTGYVQNAKTLQQMIHNSCVRLHVHTSECITSMLKYGVPLITHIDKMYNTKMVYVDTDKDRIPTYLKTDTSSEIHKDIRNYTSKVTEYLGDVSGTKLKYVRKASRKNDIKDWKFTKGESPLSFDNREATDSEIKTGDSKSKLLVGLKTAKFIHDIDKI